MVLDAGKAIIFQNIAIEDARVDQATNYDKLILEVWTNGAMKPEEAIALASRASARRFRREKWCRYSQAGIFQFSVRELP